MGIPWESRDYVITQPGTAALRNSHVTGSIREGQTLANAHISLSFLNFSLVFLLKRKIKLLSCNILKYSKLTNSVK
jgi:hypothetical protein